MHYGNTNEETEGMNGSAEVNDFLTYATSEEFQAPIGRLLGLTLIRDRVKRAKVEFQAGNRYANPMGSLHGGMLCDIADAAMGVAYSSTLARGEAYTTMELKIDYPPPGLERDASRLSTNSSCR
jgi:uncharacterized protein (TIGR00369 family)